MINYKKVEAQVKEISKVAQLMAVSKTRSLEEIMACYSEGARLFGENHVQEIVAKFSKDGKPSRPKDLELHMIGHLQSNKVNKVVPLVDLIESVDSFSLLEKINAAAQKNNKVQEVLLEVNTSREEAKSGFETEQELYDCLEKAKELKNIRVRGLMTVGPVDCAPEDKDRLTDEAFRYLKGLYDKLKAQNNFDTLSMGMSGDFKLGLKNGSTEVRIGTAIFGPRDYGQNAIGNATANATGNATANATSNATANATCNATKKGETK